jgi:hypothetical protein
MQIVMRPDVLMHTFLRNFRQFHMKTSRKRRVYPVHPATASSVQNSSTSPELRNRIVFRFVQTYNLASHKMDMYILQIVCKFLRFTVLLPFKMILILWKISSFNKLYKV